MKTMNIQKGFTMIELVMVIVILGILAAVAVPKFVDLSGKASQAAVDGMAGSLSSANAVNHAGCSAHGHTATAGKCVQVAKCSDLAALVRPALTLGTAGAAIADTYNLAADTASTTNDADVTCTLQFSKNGTAYTATFPATGAAN